jgi:hypothetical protein
MTLKLLSLILKPTAFLSSFFSGFCIITATQVSKLISKLKLLFVIVHGDIKKAWLEMTSWPRILTWNKNKSTVLALIKSLSLPFKAVCFLCFFFMLYVLPVFSTLYSFNTPLLTYLFLIGLKIHVLPSENSVYFRVSQNQDWLSQM